ncbi:MAG: hypothetical protein ACRDSS_03585 [Actinocrinis sp.]
MNSPARPFLLNAAARIDTRDAAIATAILWCAALVFYVVRVLRLPTDTSVFDLGETFLLAVACLGFQLSALRVGLDHLARIWHGTIEPAARTSSPARWRVFGRIGAASWVASLGIGLPAATGAWHPDSTDLVFALVIVLIPAVQCTGAAVIGPILTRAIQTRESAYAGRLVLLQIAHGRERSHEGA